MARHPFHALTWVVQVLSIQGRAPGKSLSFPYLEFFDADF